MTTILIPRSATIFLMIMQLNDLNAMTADMILLFGQAFAITPLETQFEVAI